MKTFVLVMFYWHTSQGGLVTVEGYTSEPECLIAAQKYISETRTRAWCIPGPTK